MKCKNKQVTREQYANVVLSNFKLNSTAETLHHAITPITVLWDIPFVKGVSLLPSENIYA